MILPRSIRGPGVVTVLAALLCGVCGLAAGQDSAAPAASEGAADRLQLLANPSFTGEVDPRGAPEGWFPAMMPARSAGLRWGIEMIDGRRVAFVSQESAGPGVFNHWAQGAFAPPPGSMLTLEADLKAEGVTEPGVAVLLTFRSADGRDLGLASNLARVAPEPVTGSGDWTPMRLHAATPEGCARVDVRVGLAPGSAGKLLIRSARLYHERGSVQAPPDTPPHPEHTMTDEAATIPPDMPPDDLALPASPAQTAAPPSASTPPAPDITPTPAPTLLPYTPPAPPPEGAVQLLTNPDFRQADAAGAPEAWFCTILKSFSSGARSGLATDAEGPYVYLTQNSASEGTFNNWAQRVMNPPAGATLQLRARIATLDAQPGAVVKLEFYRGDGTLIRAETSEGRFDLSGRNSWRTVALEATVPPDCERVIVRAGLAPLPGRGTLYLRSMRLFSYESPPDASL